MSRFVVRTVDTIGPIIGPQTSITFVKGAADLSRRTWSVVVHYAERLLRPTGSGMPLVKDAHGQDESACWR
jgi:hypothetical protein